MTDHVLIIPEPLLEFRYGQAVADPHDGLAMFGPVDTDLPSHPSILSHGLVATQKGMELWETFSQQFSGPIATEPGLSERLWPLFPGFNAAFNCRWPAGPTHGEQLQEADLRRASSHRDPSVRAGTVVDRYLGAIERIAKRDEPVAVIVCIVPDFVHRHCRPESHVSEGIGRRARGKERGLRARGQRDFFDSYDPSHYSYSVDFRRQIKARAMAHGIPIQILRESTLPGAAPEVAERRGLTPLSDRAWKIGVALCYKAGSRPWRLSGAREGVCYIGLAYRLASRSKRSSSACCAAQMFLDTGDGIVFLGQYGPWYSPERKGKQFHLSRDAARDLLAGVLRTYSDLEGKPLREIFLHCRSGIDEEEFSGFAEACPGDAKLVGIRVRQEYDTVRAYREGTRPVLRGTFWRTSDRAGYLWGTGFKPRLATYDGPETPAPMRIDIQHGEADIHQVAVDMLGLTKLNYNTCKLGDAEPVTIRFSDAVGEILVSNPTVETRSPKFRFYI